MRLAYLTASAALRASLHQQERPKDQRYRRQSWA